MERKPRKIKQTKLVYTMLIRKQPPDQRQNFEWTWLIKSRVLLAFRRVTGEENPLRRDYRKNPSRSIAGCVIQIPTAFS
jgi:hypothetical protein